jgi:chromosome segregation ATPase
MNDDTTNSPNAKSPEQAAEETREPAGAARARKRDDERTRKRLDEAERRVEDTDATLRATSGDLQANAAELERRKRELEETGEMAREVSSEASELQQHGRHTADKAAQVEPAADRDPKGER